jgi:hypothetical protein
MKLDVDRINKARRRRGLEPLPIPKRGRPRIGDPPTKAELIELYQRQGLSLRAAAEVLGTTKDAIQRGLADHGIKPRPNTKPSRLAAYSLTELRRRIKRDGLRATARALNVDPATLLEFLDRHGHKK